MDDTIRRCWRTSIGKGSSILPAISSAFQASRWRRRRRALFRAVFLECGYAVDLQEIESGRFQTISTLRATGGGAGLMLDGSKYELDALSNKNFRYLTKTYLPRTLREEDWLD